jgi:hypothetical protein
MYYEEALIWLSVFPRDQLHFVDFITSCATPKSQRQALAEAFNFLGFPEDETLAFLDEKHDELFEIHDVPQGHDAPKNVTASHVSTLTLSHSHHLSTCAIRNTPFDLDNRISCE